MRSFAFPPHWLLATSSLSDDDVKKFLLSSLLYVLSGFAGADVFSQTEVDRWIQQYEQVAQEGRRLWSSPEISSNRVVCAHAIPTQLLPIRRPIPSFRNSSAKSPRSGR